MSNTLKLPIFNMIMLMLELMYFQFSGYLSLSFVRLPKFSSSILFLCWFVSSTIYFYSAIGYIFIFNMLKLKCFF